MRVRAAKIAGGPTIVLFLSLLLASCIQPAHRYSSDDAFVKGASGRKPWARVAVLPFGGEPAFRRTAAEWLAFRARKEGLFEVVGPTLAEIELGKKGIVLREGGASVDEALAAGRLLGVDGVVLGSVPPASDPVIDRLPAVTARVVDMSSGKVVAESVQAYFAWGGGGSDGVTAGIDRAVENLRPVFYAAAGKIWTQPSTANPGSDADRERDPALR